MESCEGCDKQGSIDWCGHWLCAGCCQIEREHADPELARIAKEEREEVARIKEVDSWPASYRGNGPEFMKDWTIRAVRAFE